MYYHNTKAKACDPKTKVCRIYINHEKKWESAKMNNKIQGVINKQGWFLFRLRTKSSLTKILMKTELDLAISLERPILTDSPINSKQQVQKRVCPSKGIVIRNLHENPEIKVPWETNFKATSKDQTAFDANHICNQKPFIENPAWVSIISEYRKRSYCLVKSLKFFQSMSKTPYQIPMFTR